MVNTGNFVSVPTFMTTNVLVLIRSPILVIRASTYTPKMDQLVDNVSTL